MSEMAIDSYFGFVVKGRVFVRACITPINQRSSRLRYAPLAGESYAPPLDFPGFVVGEGDVAFMALPCGLCSIQDLGSAEVTKGQHHLLQGQIGGREDIEKTPSLGDGRFRVSDHEP